jgi:ParB-like chromosome segregation protein Spo0J
MPNQIDVDDALQIDPGHSTSPQSRSPTTKVPIQSVVPCQSLRINGEHTDHVRALAETDDELPPIVVHRTTMRVIDGMHRLRAAALRGREHIDVEFFEGDEEDAFVLAVELNANHGLPLSQADRAAAVGRIINSHRQWSDRAIASVTGLSDKTVASIRRSSSEVPQSNTRMGRDGRSRPVNSMEGRMRAARLITARPDSSLRQVAKEAGISLGTARDVRKRLEAGQDPVPRQQRGAEGQPGKGTARRSCDRDEVGTLPQAESRRPTLGELKKDPSLRHNEMGRTMLRLLEAHALGTDGWQRVIESVPLHCVDAVAGAARDCAGSWWKLAQQLEKRQARFVDGQTGLVEG